MGAVYYYFRSLAVAKPFTIARENLVLLLEQIRVKCLKLPQRAQSKAQAQKVPMKSKRPVNVLMHELSIRIAHLHGKLLLHCFRQYHFYTHGDNCVESSVSNICISVLVCVDSKALFSHRYNL